MTNVTVYERVEKIVRKGQNAGYEHFLLFPYNVFKSLFLSGSLGILILW